MERLKHGCMITWALGLITMLQATGALQWLIVPMVPGMSLKGKLIFSYLKLSICDFWILGSFLAEQAKMGSHLLWSGMRVKEL